MLIYIPNNYKINVHFTVHPYNTQVNRISSVEEGRRGLLTNVAFVWFQFRVFHFFWCVVGV